MRHSVGYLDDYWDDLGDDLGEVESWGEAEDLEEAPAARDVLRSLLRAEFATATPDAMDDALADVLGSMSAGESFNFAKALQQIGGAASQALADPTVNSVLRSALPVAGGALGTVVGGPLGTAIGSGLGNAVAGALPPVPGQPALPPRRQQRLPAFGGQQEAAFPVGQAEDGGDGVDGLRGLAEQDLGGRVRDHGLPEVAAERTPGDPITAAGSSSPPFGLSGRRRADTGLPDPGAAPAHPAARPGPRRAPPQ